MARSLAHDRQLQLARYGLRRSLCEWVDDTGAKIWLPARAVDLVVSVDPRAGYFKLPLRLLSWLARVAGMPTAIAYTRVSTSRQGQSGLGLEAQRAAIDAFCAQHGYEIAAHYTEVETGKGHDALERRPNRA